MTVNGQPLANGGAAMISDEARITIEAPEDAELIMMEVRIRD